MPEHRAVEDLCEGATPEILVQNCALAIEYWASVGSLIPDLEQIINLHATFFKGYHPPQKVGRLKVVENTVANRIFTHPDDVEKDYSLLVHDAQELLDQMVPPPSDIPDPEKFDCWPAPGDAKAWIQRAFFVAHFHARLIFIHPFSDGNGRVARLVAWGQAQRLFPAVSAAKFGAQEVDGKANPFVFENLEDSKSAYKQAMIHLTPGSDCNLASLMRYFLCQRDVNVPFPYFSPYYIGPRSKPKRRVL